MGKHILGIGCVTVSYEVWTFTIIAQDIENFTSSEKGEIESNMWYLNSLYVANLVCESNYHCTVLVTSNSFSSIQRHTRQIEGWKDAQQHALENSTSAPKIQTSPLISSKWSELSQVPLSSSELDLLWHTTGFKLEAIDDHKTQESTFSTASII